MIIFMKLISRHYKKMKIAYIKGAAFVTVIAAFFLPHYQKLQNTGDNMFTIYMNGEQIGVVGNLDGLDACLIEARRRIPVPVTKWYLLTRMSLTKGRKCCGEK